MSDKIRIGVLMGGSSSEREISYKSAENIINNLDLSRYEVIKYDIPVDDDSWICRLNADKPDIVLNALHGGKGEDGSVQGVLNCLKIPFVGSGVTASALCMDKALCKLVMSHSGIPVIEGVTLRCGEDITAHIEGVQRIGFPLIVKPNKGGSSLGISVVNNANELKRAVNMVFDTFADDAVVEKYIEGREVTCAVLQAEGEPEVISLLDINKTNGIFDYAAKYEAENWSGGISNLPSYMQDSIKGIAKKAFKLLGCEGYACVDMILMEEQVYVIEVNTLPGMTAQSLIPNAVRALNMDFGRFVDELVDYKLRNINENLCSPEVSQNSRDVKQAVYDKLDAMGISYEIDEHKAVFTIAEVDSIGAFNKGIGCKNLFLRDEKGKRHFLLVAEEHTNVDLKSVRAQIGCSRLSFGSEERLWNCLKLKPGSVSPFGVLNDQECRVELVLDKQLVAKPCLGFHPNDNTATVWLSFEDLKKVIDDNGNDVYYVDLG